MNKQKFFTKLFIVFLVIVFMYTLIVSIVFFYKNNEIVELESKNNQEMFFNQAIDHIETKFTVALSMLNHFKTSEELIVYARDQERNYYHITRVFNNLVSKMGAFDTFGFTVDIIKQSDDIIITRGGTLQRDKYYEEKGFTEENIKNINEYIESGKTNVHLIPNTMATDRGNLVGMIKKEIIHENVEILFYISFYEEYLMPHMETNQNGFGLMKGNQIISLESVLDIDTISHLFKASEEVTDYSVRQRDSSTLKDLKYIYITPKNTLKNKLSQLLSDTIKVYLVLFLFGLVLSFFAAKNMYKPIRSIVNLLRGEGDKVPRDELTFIRDTAMNIKAANTRLNETLNNNQLTLKNKFLRDLLAGLVPSDEIAKGIDQHELDVLTRECTVIIMEFIDENRLDDHFSKDAVLEIKSQTIRIVEEKLKRVSVCEIFELDYKRYILLMQEKEMKSIKKELNHALSGIEIDFDIRIVASIGQQVMQVNDIQQSFNSAMLLLEQRFAVDKRTIITIDDLETFKENEYFYPLDLERELINKVIQGKPDQVHAIVNRVFEGNLRKAALSGESLSRLLLAIVATVHRILQQINKSEDDFFAEGVLQYTELKKSEDIPQMKEKIEDIFNTIITKMKQTNEAADDHIADEMIAFVQDNFQRDISLTDLAELFNFSPGYISVLFKNHVGGNFKDYLNIYRINKAKEYFDAHPKLTVNEIGEKVGFNHVNTFLRTFKKYEGVSPGQYARRRD